MGICDSSNDTKSKDETSKKYPVPVEEPPLIPVVPNYEDDSFFQYKDCKNNSFNKYNNIPVVESPFEIKEKKSFTQTQIIEPHSIRQFINPTNPARNLQTFPVHRLKPQSLIEFSSLYTHMIYKIQILIHLILIIQIY